MVQPYHLANRQNSWYLLGHDLERSALRNYAVARMKGLVVSNRKFARPADFSPEKYFAHAFGAFAGAPDYCVTIQFDAAGSRTIFESASGMKRRKPSTCRTDGSK